MSYQDLSTYHKIAKCTISGIVPQVCDAIYTALKDDHFEVPQTEEQWRVVEKRFAERWNLPHCLGALDGKHIQIVKPNKSGSMYFNYKKFFSVILMALVDADYRILFGHTGANGRASDAGVFKHCGLQDTLENNTLNFPPAEPIDGMEGNVPYFIVGDDAFPLKMNIMKPYPQRGLTLTKRVFNYRCSRARRVSENAFGILANRFRVYHQPIALLPSNVDKVVLATVVLHNYLLSRKDNQYCGAGSFDTETLVEHNMINGVWRDGGRDFVCLEIRGQGRSANSPQAMRDSLAEYLCSAKGEVQWQWRKAEEGQQ